MAQFTLGDRVIVRFGSRQGQSGEVVESQQAQVYRVKFEDGSSLLYSGGGLQEVAHQTAQVTRLAPLGRP